MQAFHALVTIRISHNRGKRGTCLTLARARAPQSTLARMQASRQPGRQAGRQASRQAVMRERRGAHQIREVAAVPQAVTG